MKISYQTITLGCKVNQYDTGRLLNRLGHFFYPAEKTPQLIIVNSCAVTRTAINKCLQLIKKAKAENPSAFIALYGCWPEVYRSEAEASGANLVSGRSEAEFLAALQEHYSTSQEESIAEKKIIPTSRSRYFLKVQDGCRQYCSYCIIPYTRGEPHSRPAEEILEEAKAAARAGFREIVLCGIHLGLYGRDFFPTENLITLIKALKALYLDVRFRLSSLEVNEISSELIELIAQGDLCPHLHLPLQSGSEAILQKMNRPYGQQFFIDKVSEIRHKIPDIALTTDIIVGFPGESEADFQMTFALAAELGFSKIHVFPFSAHERVPAAKFSDQISEEAKRDRSARLNRLSRELEKKYRQNFIGREVSALVFQKRQGNLAGKTEYFFDVDIPSGSGLIPGELAKMAVLK